MTNREIIEFKYAEVAKGIEEHWLSSLDEKWYDYVLSLSTELKITYVVTIMHHQVFNGGFDQYFTNGYGQFAKETIPALKRIGAVRKAGILEEAYDLVSSGYISDVQFRTDLLGKKIAKLFSNDDIMQPLDDLDGQYYDAEDEDITELLGTYLQEK